MPVNWREALQPARTAIVCMEMQKGVLARSGPLRPLAEAVERHGVIRRGSFLLDAARERGIQVVHCTAAFRADRLGTPVNTPLIASLLKDPTHMLEGSEAVEVIPQWWDASDLENRRYHGVAPFTATDLDSQLRAMSVATLVVMGVSLNLGVTGLCVEAVNLGYRVVVVNDAVAGFPEDYASAVLNHTLSLIAKPMTAEQVVALWP